MDYLKVTGMVLSTMPVGEYDLRLVLLTKEKGKITAFARGARRVNNKFMGSTRMFSFGEFSLYPGRNSYSLTGAEIKEFNEDIVKDFDKVSLGSYFLEVANYFSKEELDGRDMLNLLYVSLRALAKDKVPLRLIRAIFELKVLVINGEFPDVFRCRDCDSSEEIIGFSMEKRGVVCKNHIVKSDYKISPTGLYTLQYIVTSPLNKVFSFNLKPEYEEEICKLINDFFKRQVDYKFRTLSLIEN